MSKYKIQGVGIDCSTLEFSPIDEIDFGYLFTSIGANNEEVIREFVQNNSGSPIITKIDFLDRCVEAVANHVSILGRDIDLLLVDASCDFEKYAKNLTNLLDYRYVDVIGVYNPESVDRLKEIMSIVSDIKYVGLDFCPLNFNYELMKFIKEQNISIVGFNPFGGKINSWNVINSFSVPYLLEFVATYSTLSILSGRDVYLSWKEKDYLEDLIDKEIRDENLYRLDKSISKLQKPFNKMTGISLKVDLNHTIPVGLPDSIFNPDDLEISLGDAVEDCRDFDVEVKSIEDIVYNNYRLFQPPEDTESDAAIISLFKPVVKELIIDKLGKDWVISEQRAGEKIFILTAMRPIYKGRWIFRRLAGIEIKNYLFYINNKSLEFTEISVPDENENTQFASLEGTDSY